MGQEARVLLEEYGDIEPLSTKVEVSMQASMGITSLESVLSILDGARSFRIFE